MSQPYFPAKPGETIQSQQWNDIQTRLRDEVYSHTHAGGEQGTQIDGSGIAPTAALSVQSVTATGALSAGSVTTSGAVNADSLTTIGAVNAGSLKVIAGAITPAIGDNATAGIYFPPNPGGGTGDEAFLRYFNTATTGEKAKLVLGINNDAEDALALAQAGVDRLTIANTKVTIHSLTTLEAGPVTTTTLTASALVTASKGLTVTGGPVAIGTTAANQPLTVNGTATLNGAVTIGTAAANQPLTVNGTATLNGAVTIGTTAANQPLTVNGVATVSGAVTIGTTTVPQSLQVHGTLRVGSNNAVVAAEAQRLIRGNVNADGTRAQGSGYSVVKAGTGLYDVWFDNAFGEVPTVVVTEVFPGDDMTSLGGDTRDNATVVAATAQKVRIKTGSNTGAATDRKFSFIALGI